MLADVRSTGKSRRAYNVKSEGTKSIRMHDTTIGPKDVELVDCCLRRNIIICNGSATARSFVVLSIIQQLLHMSRRPNTGKGWKMVFLSSNESSCQQFLQCIQNLCPVDVSWFRPDSDSISNEELIAKLIRCHIVLMPSEVFVELNLQGVLSIEDLCLLVVDECHDAMPGSPLDEVMQLYEICPEGNRPRLLGLTANILNKDSEPHQIQDCIIHLERGIHCSVESASDVTSVLRVSSKCQEYILECHTYEEHKEVRAQIKKLVESNLAWVEDHVYDPSIIYGEEFYEYYADIPDPNTEPKRLLREFLYILDNLGLWCADKAALHILFETEKLRKKTPHDRHYLLLCLVFTTFLQIRAILDRVFKPYSDRERLFLFSTDKLLRLLKIFHQYKLCEGPKSSDLNLEVREVWKKKEAIDACEDDMVRPEPEENGKNKSMTDSEGMDCSTNEKEMSFDLVDHDGGCEDRKDLLANGNDCGSQSSVLLEKKQGTNEVPDGSQSSVVCDINNVTEHGKRDGAQEETGRPERPDVRSMYDPDNPHCLCGMIFVERRWVAKVLFLYLRDLSFTHPDFAFLSPLFTAEATHKGETNSREAEAEHRKQEEVLRRFRGHECNVLVATGVVEEGVDIPRANLVIRFDQPSSFSSYVHSKGRCRNIHAHYLHLVTADALDDYMGLIAKYHVMAQILLERCHFREVPIDQEVNLSYVDTILPAFAPPSNPDGKLLPSKAISLINKYCAKLPSDTFTRLTPLWSVEESCINGQKKLSFRCRIRLPINSPFKQSILGPAFPLPALAKIGAALELCQMLHQEGELDDQLNPVGKESIRAQELLKKQDAEFQEEMESISEGAPRPGTTKRRQYYFKKVASVLRDCTPEVSKQLYLYKIHMTLTCPIPEEQNTRGRKIYAPEDAQQSLGILTSKCIPQVSGFPIFTRSGEVAVSLRFLSSENVTSEDQLNKICHFHLFVFKEVLRLEKYPMMFEPSKGNMGFFVVPLFCDGNGGETLDWRFIEEICDLGTVQPETISDEERKDYNFCEDNYKDAVVMPWYRNQDQPQYFYVAEICPWLNPKSNFPDEDFETFEKYYLLKYGIQIQNLSQPLLDVDLTSARLNLLTPRYVNRKGVALPTCSEQTKRARRENLQQKVILVPELCSIHPFRASLWRKAVCLPCIIYRLNCLLLADEIRSQVASEIGVGKPFITDSGGSIIEFSWPCLDFGWNLADVIKRQRQKAGLPLVAEQVGKAETEREESKWTSNPCPIKPALEAPPLNNVEQGNESKHHNMQNEEKEQPSGEDQGEKEKEDSVEVKEEKSKEKLKEEEDDESIQDVQPMAKEKQQLKQVLKDMMEIGTWSNDMASLSEPGKAAPGGQEVFAFDDPELGSLPLNLEMLSTGEDDELIGVFGRDQGTQWPIGEKGRFRVGSPSNFEDSALRWGDLDDSGQMPWGIMSGWGSVDDDLDSDSDGDDTGMKIEFHNDNTAEAIEKNPRAVREDIYVEAQEELQWDFEGEEEEELKTQLMEDADKKVTIQKKRLLSSNIHIHADEDCDLKLGCDVNPMLGINDQTFSLNLDGHFQDLKAFKSSELISGSHVELGEILVLDWGVLEWLKAENRGALKFSFDYQPDLESHPGPSPSVMLQALTMSNANDGINLERLETVGDSFLKFAITTYLFLAHPNVHEGKLSYLRSKQVSNLHLYRLGRKCGLGECMVAAKFEPHDNWLPPGYRVPQELEQALIESGVPTTRWNFAELPDFRTMDSAQIRAVVQEKSEQIRSSSKVDDSAFSSNPGDFPCFLPYNLLTQHSIPDKSVADCVEALIGAYLITCGQRGALLLMAWLGLRVLPLKDEEFPKADVLTSLQPCPRIAGKNDSSPNYGFLKPPQSPFLAYTMDPVAQLSELLEGYEEFEELIGYKFQDRSYLLQAFTHASYYPNQVTDCYQRLEFLGDAVLDYLITRHLYEDHRQHSPGSLTDLRSALVNNTIFACLAVKYNFHKYFKHLSPGLFTVLEKFVSLQIQNGHQITEEFYWLEEEEVEEAEDVEVPKALGDVFESVAGAIYLDSGLSLDAVWQVYYRIMKGQIEQFSTYVPKSPIRELLEMEPETAKFGKPERLLDGRVRVSVEVYGKGTFKGIGRNYRIAKSTAAKCALRSLKKRTDAAAPARSNL
ncbi:unnamed protein product [Darwinula stevensoni]|uniref:ribonuclease III n=1 Tax=Darwinula stevensoni TaxID=69355 RepID=A0A7R8X2E6_9CRUS|nr:unnamed protein product [Darwinula stevensoni]CAG0883281.1 unnamed protein product [Darwinula stevensoni]